MRIDRKHKLISLEELINNYSLPIPMYFEGGRGHKLLVHPYNYFASIHTLNYYACGNGVLIFKTPTDYYITLNTELFVSTLEFYRYRKLQTFSGFNPRELKPVDADARKLWDQLIADFSGK